MRIKRHRRAYTLVEVIAVVAILAILASMAVPRFTHASTRYRADAAAMRVIADLEFARRHARQANVSQAVQFDVGANNYRLPNVSDPDHPAEEYVVDLTAEPYRAEILSAEFAEGAKISFDAYGVPSSGGTVVIAVGDWKTTISVDENTGEALLP
jgi:prepilin-type N-terminal cleavage/methylation domain-containing protein